MMTAQACRPTRLITRLAAPALGGVLLAACSSAKPVEVHLSTGCDGPDGSCAKYIQGLDTEGAPVDRSSIIVPFTSSVRIGDSAKGLNAVTTAYNFETRQEEFRLIPVRAVHADGASAKQITIDIDGLLADGAAVDLPGGAILSSDGKTHAGPFTVKVRTRHSALGVGLAAVRWEPTDRSIFHLEGVQPGRGDTSESGVRAELEARLRIRPGISDEQVATILARYDGDALKRKAPDHRVRAGIALLAGTSGEPAINFIESDTNRRNVPFEPIRIAPLEQYGMFAAVYSNTLAGRMRMVIDTNLARDPLEAIAVAITHETLHSTLGGGSATEETLAMASDIRVYEEFLIWDPAVASYPSGILRVANELLLAMRNSGQFGFPSAGIMPRPGIDDAVAGSGLPPARSFRDVLFAPDFYGDIAKAGDLGSEVVEAYYQRISGTTSNPGKLRFDAVTLKMFDVSLDHGFTTEQIMAIVDALKLRPVPLADRS